MNSFGEWTNIKFKIGSVNVCVLNCKHEFFKESFPNHMHRYYELHYTLGGKGILVLDNEIYPIQSNVVYMTGPNVYHEQITDPNHLLEEYCLSIELIKAKGIKKDGMSQSLLNTTFWIGADKTNIKQLFEEILSELSNKRIGYQYMIQNKIEQILLSMVRNYQAGDEKFFKTPAILDDKRIITTENAFFFEYKTITLKNLAERLKLSERQVERFVRERYGKSFVKVRTESRLNRAKILLLSTNESISQISEKVGFCNGYYFSKLFNQQFQISPHEFRKHNAKKETEKNK
ncbi:MAG: AraC family transcriptional regulator [Clostridia bacterium]|nr:AraC family transcriptional regulator [Clostridia bacterium]